MSTRKPLPPPPREPDLDECCGNGCEPCVFDLYDQRVERWRTRCEAIEAENQTTADGTPSDRDSGGVMTR